MKLGWIVLISIGLSPATGLVASLGTSAAMDSRGGLWIAYVEGEVQKAHVTIARQNQHTGWASPIRVNETPEPVAADGENRPKLAFGPKDEMYVTWTSPTSAKYTGDVRFSRSLDGGLTWSKPIVVHRDRQRISHRFESLIVDATGRVWIAWLDKRDLEQNGREYAGAALYYAYSEDRGETWRGDFKVADHSCECCRIALSLDAAGRPTAMWRHVFERNERDHALAVLTRDPRVLGVTRVTFDRWAIDACPHHGPSLAIEDEVRHAVWFNQSEGEGRVFYGQLAEAGPAHVRALPQGAMHADVAAADGFVALAWKRYDGTATLLETLISTDSGRSFEAGPVLRTSGESDQPRLLVRGPDVVLVWRRAEDTAVVRLARSQLSRSELPAPVTAAEKSQVSLALRPFGKTTLRELEAQHRGRPFWLVMWDLECSFCMKSLTNVAEAQRKDPRLTVVTVTTDPLNRSEEILERLRELGLRSDAYAFDGAPQEALRYAIDPSWAGEKPRAYRYAANGERTALSGVLSVEDLTAN